MKISLPKLKATLLYFGEYTDPNLLGKVKLMKLFYFLDFMHVKQHGVPVTYDCYVNLEHGPIPSAIKNLVDSVGDDIDYSVLADTIRIEKTEGKDIHRIVAQRKFSEKDKLYFSENELAILKKVCLRFGDKTAKDIEDASHKEAPWKNTKLLDVIPYDLATKDNDCLISKDDINLMLRLA